MAAWHRAFPLDECPPGEGREIVVAGRIVALFHCDDGIHALDGICPHQGGPLGHGRLTGCVITCPWHGWQFDAATGQHQVNPALRHPAFAVRVVEGWIEVEVDAASSASTAANR